MRPLPAIMNISASAPPAYWPASTRSNALVKDRHRNREFIEFLRLLDALSSPHGDSIIPCHISKESKAWLAQQLAGRLEFTFTPKHGPC
jgi:hypothetical protein